jgi:hypothetical protein
MFKFLCNKTSLLHQQLKPSARQRESTQTICGGVVVVEPDLWSQLCQQHLRLWSISLGMRLQIGGGGGGHGLTNYVDTKAKTSSKNIDL